MPIGEIESGYADEQPTTSINISYALYGCTMVGKDVLGK
jgi:hypothetical protein